MIAEILVGGVWLKYQYPGEHQAEEPLYPYLVEVPPITESTSAESGNAQIVLQLDAYRNLGLPLGKQARIRDNGETLFDGIVADVAITSSITLQLEA